MTKEKPRNYEFRTIPGVSKDIRVSRDGEVKVKGRINHTGNAIGITDLNGKKMSVQMAISLAFPDIPMRYAPKD